MLNVKNYLKLKNLFLVLAVKFYIFSVSAISVKVTLKCGCATFPLFTKMICKDSRFGLLLPIFIQWRERFSFLEDMKSFFTDKRWHGWLVQGGLCIRIRPVYMLYETKQKRIVHRFWDTSHKWAICIYKFPICILNAWPEFMWRMW